MAFWGLVNSTLTGGNSNFLDRITGTINTIDSDSFNLGLDFKGHYGGGLVGQSFTVSYFFGVYPPMTPAEIFQVGVDSDDSTVSNPGSNRTRDIYSVVDDAQGDWLDTVISTNGGTDLATLTPAQ